MAGRRLRQTLPRSTRVRSRKAFARVFQGRVRASDRWMTLYAAPNEAGLAHQPGPARLGVSVGRRIGGAVQRNRAKRLIREAFRRVRHELPQGVDWVVVPRPGPEPTVADLQRSMRTLAHLLQTRLGLKPAPPEP